MTSRHAKSKYSEAEAVSMDFFYYLTVLSFRLFNISADSLNATKLVIRRH